jgi:hypothetical protein
MATNKPHSEKMVVLDDEDATPILDGINACIEGTADLPSYLSIRGLPSWANHQFLASVSERQARKTGTMNLIFNEDRCNKASQWFEIDFHDPSCPDAVADTIGTIDEAYQAWRVNTTITRNFADGDLTVRLQVPFNREGEPETVGVWTWFYMWGLPPSSVPSLNEICAGGTPAES